MFIDITFFAKLAETANMYLNKGSKVLIEGRLYLEQWTDQNGQKRSKHSIIVESMKMLDSKNDDVTNQNNIQDSQENITNNNAISDNIDNEDYEDIF